MKCAASTDMTVNCSSSGYLMLFLLEPKPLFPIAANIAEAFRKRSKPDKVRFMNIADGSLEESRY